MSGNLSLAAIGIVAEPVIPTGSICTAGLASIQDAGYIRDLITVKVTDTGRSRCCQCSKTLHAAVSIFITVSILIPLADVSPVVVRSAFRKAGDCGREWRGRTAAHSVASQIVCRCTPFEAGIIHVAGSSAVRAAEYCCSLGDVAGGRCRYSCGSDCLGGEGLFGAKSFFCGRCRLVVFYHIGLVIVRSSSRKAAYSLAEWRCSTPR